jgi:hypothetical protein
MKALGLNEKDNKSKGKTVEEKEESGMETVLNVFEKGDRGRESRGRGGRGERGRGVGVDSTQTPNTTQSKPQSPPTTNHSTQLN